MKFQLSLKKLPLFIVVILTIIFLFILKFGLLAGIINNISDKNNPPLCVDCNLVIIDVDVLRSDALDCSKQREVTPNLCSFSESSVFFGNHYAMSDLTKTDYVSVITSTYPLTHQVWSEMHEYKLNLPTIAEILKNKGYKTIYYGLLNDLVAVFRGFDVTEEGSCALCKNFKPFNAISGKNGGSKPVFAYIYIDDLHFPYLPRDGRRLPNWQEAPESLPVTINEFNENFKKYIANHPGEVFSAEFINKNSKLFGNPVKNKDEIYGLFTAGFRNKNENYVKNAWVPYFESFLAFINTSDKNQIDYLHRSYLLTLTLVDKQIGLLLKELEDNGYYKNSVIILRTNHGEEFFEHGQFAHGNNLYEELIHTPLAVKIPGINPVNIKNLTQDIDLAPTVLDILGIDKPGSFQGKSMLPLIRKPGSIFRDYQIAQKGGENYIESYRKGDWKLIIREGVQVELYNLSKDPDESENIIKKNPDLAANMFKDYMTVKNSIPVFSDSTELLPDWIDEEKRERLKKEGYF